MSAAIQFKTFCLLIYYKNVQIRVCKTVIFSAVLDGRETCSVTENRILRRISGATSGEVNTKLWETV
jgi:hypothetical protein